MLMLNLLSILPTFYEEIYKSATDHFIFIYILFIKGPEKASEACFLPKQGKTYSPLFPGTRDPDGHPSSGFYGPLCSGHPLMTAIHKPNYPTMGILPLRNLSPHQTSQN